MYNKKRPDGLNKEEITLKDINNKNQEFSKEDLYKADSPHYYNSKHKQRTREYNERLFLENPMFFKILEGELEFDKSLLNQLYISDAEVTVMNTAHTKVCRCIAKHASFACDADAKESDRWITPYEIHVFTGIKESTVSANLRDLRKAPAGKHSVIRRHRGNGIYEYCIIPDTKGRNTFDRSSDAYLPYS